MSMTIKRIVLCGSVRINGDNMHALAIKLRKCGLTVTEPYDVPYNRTHDPHEKSVNMKFYYKAIAECNAVIVYSDKHIGFETACEIGYTIGCHKNLYFTHEVDIDGVKALLISERAKPLPDIDEFINTLNGLTVKCVDCEYYINHETGEWYCNHPEAFKNCPLKKDTSFDKQEREMMTDVEEFWLLKPTKIELGVYIEIDRKLKNVDISLLDKERRYYYGGIALSFDDLKKIQDCIAEEG